METERALRDVSRIDAHYVSQVITVMSSWQEVVQTAASHMEGVDTTIYLARREDAQKATQESHYHGRQNTVFRDCPFPIIVVNKTTRRVLLYINSIGINVIIIIIIIIINTWRLS